MLSLHGGIFLTLKAEDELLERVRHLAPRLMMAAFIPMTMIVVWTLLLNDPIPDHFSRAACGSESFRAALVATIIGWRRIAVGQYLTAFSPRLRPSPTLMTTVAAGLYPVMLPSSTNPAYNLTDHNAASAEPTLRSWFVIAVIGIPFVLRHTAGVYYFFEARVVLDATATDGGPWPSLGRRDIATLGGVHSPCEPADRRSSGRRCPSGHRRRP